MKATIAVAESTTESKYELVINDEFYVEITRKQFKELKDYITGDKEFREELDKFVGHKVKIKFIEGNKEIGILRKFENTYTLDDGYEELILAKSDMKWIKRMD